VFTLVEKNKKQQINTTKKIKKHNRHQHRWWWASNGRRVDTCTDEQVRQAYRSRKWPAIRFQ